MIRTSGARGRVSSAFEELCNRFPSAYGCSPGFAVRGLANSTRIEAKQLRLPVDLRQIAQMLGLAVEEQNVQADGLLADWPGPRPRIILRRVPASTSISLMKRQRFTLAHEIGHFVIREELRARTRLSRFGLEDPDEERLCNEFAAELLMPSGNLGRDLEYFGVGAKTVLRLAERYAVSLQALLNQIRWLCDRSKSRRNDRSQRLLAVIWSYKSGGVTPHWTNSAAFRNIVLCDNGQSTVERAFHAPVGKETRGNDSFRTDGVPMRWQCYSTKLPRSQKVLTLGFRSSLRKIEWASNWFDGRGYADHDSLPIQKELGFTARTGAPEVAEKQATAGAGDLLASSSFQVAAARREHLERPLNDEHCLESFAAPSQLRLFGPRHTEAVGHQFREWW
jgi:IrrE N-terminal-like domain